MIASEGARERTCVICLSGGGGTGRPHRDQQTVLSQRFLLVKLHHVLDTGLTRTTSLSRFACACNVFVHRRCLNAWIDKTKKCPICLQPLRTKRVVSARIALADSLSSSAAAHLIAAALPFISIFGIEEEEEGETEDEAEEGEDAEEEEEGGETELVEIDEALLHFQTNVVVVSRTMSVDRRLVGMLLLLLLNGIMWTATFALFLIVFKNGGGGGDAGGCRGLLREYVL